MKLQRHFFTRSDVTLIAKDLLGKVLYTRVNGLTTAGRIVETEAYSYMEKACHAHNNRFTNRSKVMFEEGGTSYVYLCYGIHRLFNIVTNVEGTAEAVLIRALEPIQGLDQMFSRRGAKMVRTNLTSGPGKLTVALGIDLVHNNLDLTLDNIWLEDQGEALLEDQIEVTPRIGIAYAKEDALLPWRFSVRDNPHVSKGINTYDP